MGIKEVAKRLGVTERAVRKQCIAGKLAGARKVGGSWQVPDTADIRLCRIKTPRQPITELNLDGINPKKVKEGLEQEIDSDESN